MIMKKLILLLLIAASAQAQHKLNRVTVEELAESKCPVDTAAAAAILFKATDLYFKVAPDGYWNVVIETKMKIKIYKKEGYRFANVEETYYSDANGDIVRFEDAATYNLVDGKVVRTKIKSEGEFTEQTAKKYKTKKISLPNVKEGSIIEYTCTRTTYRTVDFPDFYFQYDIPVRFVEYRVATPEDFTYNRMQGGFLKFEQKEERLVSSDGGYDQLRTTYSIKDVPALKEEEFVNNINNYRLRIIYELSSKKDKKGYVENYATNWEAVTTKIYEDDDFGAQLNKSGYFEDDLKAILDGVVERDKKISAIFNFVQSRMTWNEYRGYFCEQGVKTAYKNKTGNVGDINLMLTAMLRHANLDANPVLVSTRSNGIAMFPSRTAFNYVICAVESDTGTLLLDATNKNSQPGILPIRVLNWNGRMIRKDGTSAEIDLMPKKNSPETINVIAGIDAKGLVSGKVRDTYADYYAFTFRENYADVSKDSYLEKMEKRYHGLTIGEYAVANKTDRDKPVTEDYSFTHENIVEVVGDRMYFSPLLFFVREENPFKEEKREYPVDFIFPYRDRYNINITLPDGYVVESLPTAGIISAEGNIGSFKYNIASKGQSVQLSVVYDINYPVVAPQYYETLKGFFKEMITKHHEKIVLKKV